MRLLFLTVMSVFATSAWAQHFRSGPVLIVAALDAKDAQHVTLDFYHEVKAELVASGQVRLQEVSDSMLKELTAAVPVISSVPHIGRADLVRSLEAKSAKKNSQELIARLQYVLDSTVNDGAIIVDCTPDSSQTVRDCGLYFYERAASQIRFLAKKSFKVPLREASSWAKPLTQQFVAGVENRESEKNRQKVQDLLHKDEQEDKAQDFFAMLSLGGSPLHEPTGTLKSIPSVKLSLGMLDQNYSLGLAAEYGTTAEKSSGRQVKATSMGVGIETTALSAALESIYWSLGLGFYVTDKNFTEKSDSTDIGKIHMNSLKLRIFPGIHWQVHRKFLLGGSVSYTADVPLQVKGDGAFSDGKMMEHGFGFALSVLAKI